MLGVAGTGGRGPRGETGVGICGRGAERRGETAVIGGAEVSVVKPMALPAAKKSVADMAISGPMLFLLGRL